MKRSSFWPVKQNWLTRSLALMLAVLIIVVLFLVVDREVGNPLGCWYTEKKIEAHYRAYHPGVPYVISPAKFTYADDRMRYVCHIYLQGSRDTGFLAYFQDGAVLSTEAAETLSGNNTYNRFRLRLNEEALTPELRAQSRQGPYGINSLWADFYPGERQMVFDAEHPVFEVDAEYDRDHLPLPTVLCAEFRPDMDGGTQDEDIAARLRWLQNLAEENGQKFDYYSVHWYNGINDVTAQDIPSRIITPPGKDAEEDPLLRYLEELPAAEKISYYPPNTLQQQKGRLLYSQQSIFLPCADHNDG